VIKYHGTPMTNPPMLLEQVSLQNKYQDIKFLVSWANKQDIDKILNLGNRFILDNGAFTFYDRKKRGLMKKNPDWNKFFKWVDKYPQRDNFFIPDVIEGTERENDDLLKLNPFEDGIPVWHIHESFERLERLANDYNYIAFGSSGEYWKLGTTKWHKRINESLKIVCDKEGNPLIKIHMLRCLDARIFTQYPFYSGDSTNVARNSRDKAFQKILDNIEPFNSPIKYKFKTFYETGNIFEN